MQGGKNCILLKYINENRAFRVSHWLEIWKNRFCPSMAMGPTELRERGMDSGHQAAAALPGDGQLLPPLHTDIASVLEPSVVYADQVGSETFFRI